MEQTGSCNYNTKTLYTTDEQKKTTDNKNAHEYDDLLILQQLVSNGILQTIELKQVCVCTYGVGYFWWHCLQKQEKCKRLFVCVFVERVSASRDVCRIS